MFRTVTSQQLKHNPADITISNKTADEYSPLVPGTDLKALETKMKNRQTWNDDVCYQDYVTQYIFQLQSPACRKVLNKLYQESKAGKTIIFANHNKGNDHSWSSVLMGLMQGAKAECETPTDYSHYFTIYKQTRKA